MKLNVDSQLIQISLCMVRKTSEDIITADTSRV